MAKLVVVALCALLGGCVEVVDATPRGVWINVPMFSLDSPDSVAAKHCARYNRQAVKQGQFGGPDTPFVPLIAYDCR